MPPEPLLFLDGRVTLHAGDCLAVLDALPEASIDAIVTDPPYHLTSIVRRFGAEGAAPAKDYSGEKDGATGAYARASRGFMGKQWDGGDIAFRMDLWRKVLRVLKPGGHVVAFSGTQTYHRMACAIEDAGFEIRDDVLDMFESDVKARAFMASLNDEQRSAMIALCDDTKFSGLLAWVYGSGFPKSHDVSKAIDRAAGLTRDHVPVGVAVKRMIPGADQHKGGWEKNDGREYQPGVSIPASDAARAWEGWGTALKPAWEPICFARKPLSGTVAENVLAHGVGALNIDACRVDGSGEKIKPRGSMDAATDINEGWARPWMADATKSEQRLSNAIEKAETLGRWPANIVHDGSDEVLAAFPDAPGQQADISLSAPSSRTGNVYGKMNRHGEKSADTRYADQGSTNFAALPGARRADAGSAARFFYTAKADADDRLGSKHPTVKPVDLMRWLVRLICPKGGVVLDPFAGTGTTGQAAFLEGCDAVLIEREEEYRADIARRMDLVLAGPIVRKAAVAKPASAIGGLFGGLDPLPGGAGVSTAIMPTRTNGAPASVPETAAIE